MWEAAMRPGDNIWLRVFKSDGSPYRWWRARVEAVRDGCIITYAPAGDPVHHNPDYFPQAIYYRRWHIRAYYWPGRRHNLLEIYDPDGRLYELYADIISPIELGDGELRFVDHELDVAQLTGEAPQIIDQDEFAEAAERFGYSEQFMRESYNLANELLEFMTNWKPLGMVSG
jgi:protein associated with RNAse G/E